MNLEKLKYAEHWFLNRYPDGFSHPDMQAIGKKHKMDRMIALTQESFAKKNFRDTSDIIDNMVKIVSRSSMVSVFEKPKFKDFTASLQPKEKNALVAGLKKQLHGDERKGFEEIVNILKIGKMAKWTLISICPVYFKPLDDVFVKPTTAKGIIAHFELENLLYKPQPYWEFYQEFRSTINDMKTKVDSSLSPNNAAFTGFLMMSMASLNDL
ncbi:MAG: hypothetical protein COA96_13015 [SAR86 cluster bacterium]|uniref:Uncharacterized protein n=1 Tax=SAR86 cluster bacterium TaxID=2030880 RepID=A0A2A5AUN3_9GAMM|nr:MAG: hypothetical protein COA96_13015 [SAR86 cluster bacterium]